MLLKIVSVHFPLIGRWSQCDPSFQSECPILILICPLPPFSSSAHAECSRSSLCPPKSDPCISRSIFQCCFFIRFHHLQHNLVLHHIYSALHCNAKSSIISALQQVQERMLKGQFLR